MTYIVLHADRLTTALVDDPIVPASDMRALNEAVALFAEAGVLRGEIEQRAEAARVAAHGEGYAAGHAAGREAGAAEIRAELFRLAVRDGEERGRRQAEIATLALEVVRRIAGEIGEPALVAGLAERATAALLPDAVATVRVAPGQVEAVVDRLAGRSGIKVEADATLAPSDCVVETALGHTHAGLDTQLAQIETAWREAGR
jgi:type III secretion protein L